MRLRALLFFSMASCVAAVVAQAQDVIPQHSPIAGPPVIPGPMTFFITSVGKGDGGNLGGLKGADEHCQALAEAVGAGNHIWRAYLSTQEKNGVPAVNARDRIGNGPWYNSKGVLIARSLEELTYDNSGLNYQHSLNEKGERIGSLSMGDKDNQKDIMTGTSMDGTAIPGPEDATCNNWTSNDKGAAMSGHHDRYNWYVPGSPWNSAHLSHGCSKAGLKSSGGDGLFYCFATN